MNKLGHRAVVVHRQNVFDAGQAMLQDADEATLLRQTHFETYPQMSEGEAVGYLLERCNALDERDAARAECNAARKRTATTAALERAPMAAESGAEREARLRARRVRRCEYLGIEPDEGARHAVTSTDPATSSAEALMSEHATTMPVGSPVAAENVGRHTVVEGDAVDTAAAVATQQPQPQRRVFLDDDDETEDEDLDVDETDDEEDMGAAGAGEAATATSPAATTADPWARQLRSNTRAATSSSSTVADTEAEEVASAEVAVEADERDTAMLTRYTACSVADAPGAVAAGRSGGAPSPATSLGHASLFDSWWSSIEIGVEQRRWRGSSAEEACEWRSGGLPASLARHNGCWGRGRETEDGEVQRQWEGRQREREFALLWGWTARGICLRTRTVPVGLRAGRPGGLDCCALRLAATDSQP